MILTDKPAPFICLDCGEVTEPRLSTFPEKHWIVAEDCLACLVRRREADERAGALRSIDGMAAGIGYTLLCHGLTPKLQQARIEQVHEKLRRLLDMPFGAFLYGPPGTGKSFLLAALLIQAAMEALAHAREVVIPPNFEALPYFSSVSDLLQRLRLASLGRSENHENEAHVIRLFTHFPVLMLDDIGVRRSTEFSEDCLYEIINGREQLLLPTFFTSNFSLRELATRIEPRTVSRIAGMTAGRVFFLGGADRRLTVKDAFRTLNKNE